jgi:hypothetical protein
MIEHLPKVAMGQGSGNVRVVDGCEANPLLSAAQLVECFLPLCGWRRQKPHPRFVARNIVSIALT